MEKRISDPIRFSKRSTRLKRNPSTPQNLLQTRISAELFLSAAINQLEDELNSQPYLEASIILLEEGLTGLVDGSISYEDIILLIEQECGQLEEFREGKVLAAIDFLMLSLASLYQILPPKKTKRHR
jgi:hypothetical protein